MRPPCHAAAQLAAALWLLLQCAWRCLPSKQCMAWLISKRLTAGRRCCLSYAPAALAQAPQESYSVFMLLGNDKLPIVVGLGHVNFYMCQVR